MSGVSALLTGTGNSMTGSITLATTQPALLGVSNTTTAPFTINFSPVAGGTNTVGGKNGDIVLATPDGCLAITADPISPTLNFNAYNATTNTSGMVANNISGALAWNSANAYAVGAVVISSGTTYVCLTAQPASSPAPTNGANWQSIGGGGGGGGNWSYRGVFNTTPGTAYALNDVVFDTVNTAQTYVCIVAFTVAIPVVAPSSNATNWLLFATNSAPAGGASITNTGATLGINTTGVLSYTTPNTPSFLNQINLATTVPTTSPGVDAGRITLDSAEDLFLKSATQITLSSPQYVSVVNPTPNYSTGNVLTYASPGGAWSAPLGYLAGQLVLYNTVWYISLQPIAPLPAGNPTPDVDTATWSPLSSSGSSAIANAGSSLDVNATGDLVFSSGSASANTNQIDLTTVVPAGQTSTSAGQVRLRSNSASEILMNLDGEITIQNFDNPSLSNSITIQTVLPTTTPPALAGSININAGGPMVIQVNPGGGNLAVKNDEPTADIEIISKRNIYIDNSTAVGSADVIVKPNITGTGLKIECPPTYGTGDVPFNTGVWSDQTGYLTGSVVQETAGGASFICIAQVSPNTTIPYNPAPSATPTSWLPLGAGGGSMELASGAGAIWSPTAGYPLGAVVNNTSPTGIWVCIQTVPTPAPPATNPNPTTSPTFWTELVSNTTAPGSAMMFLNTWSNASAYAAQEVVIYNGFVYVCISPVVAPVSPAVNPNPNVSPASWLILSNNPVFPTFDATGATAYPVGSIVQNAGVYYYAQTAYVVPAPPVAIPVPVLGAQWALFTTNVINQSALAVANPFPLMPFTFSTLELIPTDESQTAPVPTTSYTGNNGATGFVTGGTPYALIPGRRYKVSWDMLLNGISGNANENVAKYTIYLGFDASVSAPITALPTTYYELAATGDLGLGGFPIPSIEFSGELNFTAPLSATVLSFIVKNELIIQGAPNDPGFPAVSTVGPFLSFGFKNASSGLNITAYG